MGEPSKLILLEAVLDTIAKENLLARVTEVGDDMISGLEDLASKYPGVFSNVRGKLDHLFIILTSYLTLYAAEFKMGEMKRDIKLY